MVRIVDDGSHFEAPLDKVWQLIAAHEHDGAKIHPELKNATMASIGENQGTIAWVHEERGQKMPMKLRVTALPPFAQVLELLEGPLAGSKFINYYTANGNRTRITVVGDFASPMLPPAQLEAAVHEFLDNGFNEDGAYLKKMR